MRPQLPSHCRLVEEDTGTRNSAAFHIECEGQQGPTGSLVGRIKIHKLQQKIKGKTVYTVSGINVDEKYQRQGLGTLLYEAAAREACRRRGRLASTERNFEARSLDFWRKQERKGRAVRVPQKRKYKLTGEGRGPDAYDAFMLLDCEEPIDLSAFQLPKFQLPNLQLKKHWPWYVAGAGALAVLIVAPSHKLQPGQIRAVRTLLSRSQATNLLRAALQNTLGRAPTEAELKMLVAQSALETRNWQAMFHWNFGNSVTSGQPWYTLAEKTTHHYRPFGSAQEGANYYVNLIKNRFAQAWALLGSGNTAAFAAALKAQNYYEAPLANYQRALASQYAAA